VTTPNPISNRPSRSPPTTTRIPAACASREIHLIPVLLGQGRRLFDHLAAEHIELERTRILEGEDGVTHMHYRVQR
jgi:hypothetical protein